jgi:16S rRNA (guanine527-N7)-methyltransferase
VKRGGPIAWADLEPRFDLPAGASERLATLIDALSAEPDPPTTLTDRRDARDRHAADSLSGLEVLELRQARRIADVGSGAGFPGLPLAIALPNARIDLVESNRRKSAVIERLIAAAGIANARPVPQRVEDWARLEGSGAYDAVTARAVSSLAVLLEYAAPLLGHGGILVAWKGERTAGEERAGVAAAAEVGMEAEQVFAVSPFEGARHRHLHVYRKVAPTPERFPRRPGMAEKRPLR